MPPIFHENVSDWHSCSYRGTGYSKLEKRPLEARLGGCHAGDGIQGQCTSMTKLLVRGVRRNAAPSISNRDVKISEEPRGRKVHLSVVVGQLFPQESVLGVPSISYESQRVCSSLVLWVSPSNLRLGRKDENLYGILCSARIVKNKRGREEKKRFHELWE